MHRTARLPLIVAFVAFLFPHVTGAGEEEIVKQLIRGDEGGPNLLRADAWQPWQQGFDQQQGVIVCDNGADTTVQRGASQTVQLDQDRPEPIVATVTSRADEVTGAADSNYSLYLDLLYADGSHLYGQTAPFDVGTHDWQTRRVLVVPEKPIRQVSMHLLLRGHGGQAWFRDPSLSALVTPRGAARFDGIAVVPRPSVKEGFQVRDVAADSDFVAFETDALGLKLACRREEMTDSTMFDVTVTDTTGQDRAITLLYSVPVDPHGLTWLEDPRRSVPVQAGREYANVSRFAGIGANGRLSRYPFAAVCSESDAMALGIDMLHPAWYRVSYNAATSELYLAFDIGLTAESPTAQLRFCRFTFDGGQAFRGALSRYYELFAGAFVCRTPQQGLWMPFAKISDVQGWQDFGFQFKEGDNETDWDDQHDVTTFRYTEPMTWWMRMPKEMPRTMDAAVAYARQLADEKQDPRARALLTSGYHDSQGRLAARMLDTPWCDGAVWSMNSMPGIRGEVTDFGLKWNDALQERLYGPNRSADLDGEYIDSSEGYVTDELDFRRDHFAAATTPLTFCANTHQPAIFRGLIAFEYVQGIARDVHGRGGVMMANSTPIRLCWLAPLLDVMGTETDWNPGNQWRPMSDADLLYRRVLCKGKPYCFLMNSRFEDFSHQRVEKYMQRALAYGMFPGFFSHNASEGHYFTRPELYDRDRPLFLKYVPLCKLVAEAGWEPITEATSSDEKVYVERFGQRYLTVFNDSDRARRVTITAAFTPPSVSRELVRGQDLTWSGAAVTLELEAEGVAVLQLK